MTRRAAPDKGFRSRHSEVATLAFAILFLAGALVGALAHFVWSRR